MNTVDSHPPEPGGSVSFTPLEKRVVWGVTALFSLRMAGFYLVLPVLSTYAQGLSGSTPLLVGMSVGVYGLTQFLFQVPFGAWSDRWGRKPVLTVGLVLFAVGSGICALAGSGWMLVIGRLVQGMGAIASVIVAMLADLTRDQVRTRAMVTVGISIGGTFSLGLILGPAAADHLGVPTLFWITAALTVLAIGYLWWKIPDPPKLSHHEDVEYTNEHLFEVLTNRQLLRLDLGTMNLHMSLTSIFVVVPFLLRQFVPLGHQWRVFLPLLTIGLLVMLSGARLSERPGWGKKVALAGQGLLVIALVLFAITAPESALTPAAGLTTLVAGLCLFIMAFALLEPLFPALLTRLCQQANRGTAAGVFNMSQFSGAFIGGIISGFFLERNMASLFWILAASGLIWFFLAMRLEDPEHMSVMELHLGKVSPLHKRHVVLELLKIRGVEDVAWEGDRHRLLVRYASEKVDPPTLRTRFKEQIAPAASSTGSSETG